MTVGEWLKLAAAELTEARTGSELLDSELILGFVVRHDRAWLKAHDDVKLSKPELEKASSLIKRRAAREPLVHLTGTREFFGLDFAITPDVLTPRVETEQMAEWAIKYAPQNSRLVDIGTGSGALAIAIKAHRSDLSVTATEVSEAALVVARKNSKTHKAVIEFVLSDLWE